MKEAGPLDQLIRSLSRLPGLGPRSARRIALHLLTTREKTLIPLIGSLQHTLDTIVVCSICGNLDSSEPCRVCLSENRNRRQICIVASVADLWAIERTGAYRGLYHVLGGVLSALDGVTPDKLRLTELLDRLRTETFDEAILALSATVDGQATAHYITDRLHGIDDLRISRLAHGVPVGGELDYLDDGTITTALKSRSRL